MIAATQIDIDVDRALLIGALAANCDVTQLVTGLAIAEALDDRSRQAALIEAPEEDRAAFARFAAAISDVATAWRAIPDVARRRLLRGRRADRLKTVQGILESPRLGGPTL